MLQKKKNVMTSYSHASNRKGILLTVTPSSEGNCTVRWRYIPCRMKQQAFPHGHSIKKTIHLHDHTVYATLAIVCAMTVCLQ